VTRQLHISIVDCLNHILIRGCAFVESRLWAEPLGPSSQRQTALPTNWRRNDNVVNKQRKPELQEVSTLDDPPEKLQPSEMG